LNRFDGHDFKNYYCIKEDSTSMPDNYIQSIQEIKHGYLLIQCGNDYTVYDSKHDVFIRDLTGHFKKYGINFNPSKMFIDSNNCTWIYDAYNGVYFLPDGKNKVTKLVDSNNILTAQDVTDITQCGDLILMVNKLGNIIAVDAKSHKIKWKDSSIYNSVLSIVPQQYRIYCDRNNQAWCYSIDGLWIFDLNKHCLNTNLAQYVTNLAIPRAITQDKSGNIWIGQDQRGIDILNCRKGRLLSLSNTERLNNNTISALYTDPYGNVWIGTYKKGLYQYNSNMFKFKLNSFPDVNCITSSGNDIVWVGTDSGNLIKWNMTTNSCETITCPNKDNKSYAIASIFAANDHKIWIGTYRGGLICYDNGQFTHYQTSDGLASENIWSIISNGDGALWLGTLNGGIQLFNPATKTCETFNTRNSHIISDYVNSLFLDSNGKLYIGTTQGVSIMDTHNYKITNKIGSHESKDIFANPNITQLLVDSHKLLWMATCEGLYVYDERLDRIYVVPIKSRLYNPYILGIIEDIQGNLWASIGAELVKVETSRDNSTQELSFTTHSYNQSDGLQNSDFNQRSFHRLHSGEILIGGLYGINSYCPQLIKYNDKRPTVMFTDLSLFNQTIKVGEKHDGIIVIDKSLNDVEAVNLRYSQNDFTVHFATDNYIIPQKTTYYYRLIGFNDTWMKCAPNMHQVTYTNLTPGTYTLEVKATNNDGYESTRAATLKIIIHPPFWRSLWAYIIYAILLIFIIIFMMRFIKQRERDKYIEQKKATEIKQQEEVNQMKFRFFTNISHELRTPLTLIISPLEAMLKETSDDKQHRRLEIIHNNANHLLYLVNQLLDFRKNEITGLKFLPSEGDVIAFIKNLCDSFDGYSEKKNIKLTFYSSQESLTMTFDADKLGKIILNLLSNAFKYTPDGGRVDVAINRDNDNLVIKVADTGIGISDKDKPLIFNRFYQTDTSLSSGSGIGLSLVSEYAKLHQGSVKVVDNIDHGCVFIVTIPIRQSESADSKKTGSRENSATDNQDNTNKSVALIVDDNNDLLTFLRDEISADFKVITATNGVEALEQIEQHTPDIIVTDIMMPKMDGNELCRHLKSDKHYASIPIIVLSAKHDVSAKVEGLTVGADDYMTKPFNCDLLLLRMKKLVETRAKNSNNLIDPEPKHIQVTSLDEKFVESAIKYVEDNMSRPDLSVEELSRHLGMSRVHLYKRLRQVTGKTPVEFIRVLRLKRAAQLLRESQLNVSEIAYQVGFNNPKYFSSYFRDEFGVLPSVYQEKECKATNYTPK
jgi:signal transduction histidine kinase/DNA-binding response OmpR family regulator/ligand-binding sensor domain-containing protein